ncbi:hypothetical protein GJV14_23945 [Enterobacteriaceae bacterium RIT697]|nr:hypothetical protein [Enterobacteriaceae bacterium RIT697]
MGVNYWFIVVVSFVIGSLMLGEAIVYIRRGIYTKTFKGVSRREYIPRADRPYAFWFNLIAHMIAGTAMIYAGFWFLSFNPEVSRWYAEFRALINI